MAEWASSLVAVRRSWGWWRCRWRGGFIRAGARGKHRPESAARSNYLQGSPLGEGLHRQRDMHPSFFWHCWRQQILDLHVVYVSKKKAQWHSPGVPHANADTRGGSPGASYRALPEWLPGASPAPACLSGCHIRVVGLDALGISSARRLNPIQKLPTNSPHHRHSLEAHCMHTQFQQPRS